MASKPQLRAKSPPSSPPTTAPQQPPTPTSSTMITNSAPASTSSLITLTPPSPSSSTSGYNGGGLKGGGGDHPLLPPLKTNLGDPSRASENPLLDPKANPLGLIPSVSPDPVTRLEDSDQGRPRRSSVCLRLLSLSPSPLIDILITVVHRRS